MIIKVDGIVSTIKKYRRSITLIFGAVVFVSLFGLIRLSDVSVDREQIIESGGDGGFTAKLPQVDSFAISIDGDMIPEDTFAVVIYDSSGNVVTTCNISSNDVKLNCFGENICISPETINFNVNQKYYVKVMLDGKVLKNVSVLLSGSQVSVIPMYAFICIIGVGLLCLMLLFYHADMNISYLLFVIMMLSLGIYNCLAIKPLNVPDEPTHFAQSYELSNRILGKDRSDISTTVYQSGIIRENNKISIRDDYFFYTDFDYGNNAIKETSSSFTREVSVPLYCYIPGALGITIARLFNMPYQFVIILGRITSILFLSLMAAFAMRLYQPFSYAISAICFIPAVVWLSASYSYDVWNLSFIFVFVSLCFRIREQSCGVRVRDVISLLMLLVLFAPVKFIYITIAIAVFFIPIKQWKNKGAVYTMIGSVITAALVMAVTRGKEAMSYLFTYSMDRRGANVTDASIPYTLSWTLHHPFQTVLVYVKTFIAKTGTFTMKSATGEFYSSYVPSFLAVSVIIVFILMMIISIDNNDFDGKFVRKDRGKAIGLFILGGLAVYTAFFYLYSVIQDQGIGMIGGMQGRYFVPFFIFLPIILHSDKINGKLYKMRNLKKMLIGIMVLLNICVIFAKFVGIAADRSLL